MRRLLGFPRRLRGVTEIVAGAIFSVFVSDVSDFVSADFVCFPLLLGVTVEVL